MKHCIRKQKKRLTYFQSFEVYIQKYENSKTEWKIIKALKEYYPDIMDISS